MNNKWLCIFGAPCDNIYGFKDKTAWFVSFESVSTLNLIQENDLMELAHRFTFGVYHTMTDGDERYNYRGADRRGQWQTAYDYAGIDMSKLWVHRDTTWTFTAKGRTYNSVADKNMMTNIAYKGNDGELKLLRCIADNTLSGPRPPRTTAFSKDNSTTMIRSQRTFLHPPSPACTMSACSSCAC